MKKFEFVLYINGNIICQRYFSVKNYNRDVRYSMDLKECIDDCVQIIQTDLKDKSKDYLYKQYNPWQKQTQEELDANKRDVSEKEDVFDFEIKVDDRPVVKSRFSGNLYPQRVRYSVDVRKLIPEIISTIQDTFSQEYFTVEYSGIEL
jgi:hypothetical protein